MTSKELLSSVEKVIEVTASGKTMDETLSKGISVLRKKVYQEVNGQILKMEALSIKLKEVEQKTFTEKFLFLFAPREKNNYVATYEILVEIKYVETLDASM